MSNSYYILHFSNLNQEAAESLVGECFEHSCLGTSQSLEFQQKQGWAEVEVSSPHLVSFDSYFSQKPAQTWLDGLKSRGIDFALTQNQETDWLAEWKKGFQSFKLVGHYWVVPKWEAQSFDLERSIVIEPKMAFGNGTHETTQLAAEMVHDQLCAGPASKTQLLDVGTGSGILAILAAKMKCARVAATDIDREALEAAKQNVLDNAVTISLSNEDVALLSGVFDIVVANIVDGVLMQLKRKLVEKTAFGGPLDPVGNSRAKTGHIRKRIFF